MDRDVHYGRVSSVFVKFKFGDCCVFLLPETAMKVNITVEVSRHVNHRPNCLRSVPEGLSASRDCGIWYCALVAYIILTAKRSFSLRPSSSIPPFFKSETL